MTDLVAIRRRSAAEVAILATLSRCLRASQLSVSNRLLRGTGSKHPVNPADRRRRPRSPTTLLHPLPDALAKKKAAIGQLTMHGE